MSVWIAFIGGVITFVSPCILPMVPVYLAYLSGISIKELREGESRPTLAIFFNSLAFVLGFTLVFTALAALFYLFVQTLGAYKVWFNRAAGVVLIVFALHLWGVIQIPFLNYEMRAHADVKRRGWVPSLLMGMAFGAGWTPCIGPILSGILFNSSSAANPFGAVVLLLFYSLGLGLPFVLTGVLTARLIGLIDWVKKHMKAVERIAAVFVAFLGLLLLLDGVNWISGAMNTLFPWLSEIEGKLFH